MSRHYSKADVDIYEGYPSVNVKVWNGYDWQRHATAIGQQFGYPGFTPEWCEEHIRVDDADYWFQAACESQFELAESDAEEVFSDYLNSYPVRKAGLELRGRSGGHLVMTSLPDVETWDAVMLSRWRKFARWARDTADAVPEVMVELVALNAYDRWLDDQDQHETAADEAFTFYAAV